MPTSLFTNTAAFSSTPFSLHQSLPTTPSSCRAVYPVHFLNPPIFNHPISNHPVDSVYLLDARIFNHPIDPPIFHHPVDPAYFFGSPISNSSVDSVDSPNPSFTTTLPHSSSAVHPVHLDNLPLSNKSLRLSSYVHPVHFLAPSIPDHPVDPVHLDNPPFSNTSLHLSSDVHPVDSLNPSIPHHPVGSVGFSHPSIINHSVDLVSFFPPSIPNDSRDPVDSVDSPNPSLNTVSFVKMAQQQNDPGQFSRLLEEYPLYTLQVGNMCWHYRACGKGSETLLLLPGAPGLSFTCFPDMQFFEQHFRLIVPDYPAQAQTLATLVEGLADLLLALDIEHVYLVGGSYGGLIAQAFVQAYPKKVRKLVLSHSTLPRKRRAIFFRVPILLMKVLPAQLISLLMQAGLPLYMRTFPGQRDLWYACFGQVVKTLQKNDYLARLRVHADFDRKHKLGKPYGWAGPTLLIASNDDPYTNIHEQAILQQRYPQAITYTFQRTSHYAWATNSLAYFSLIKSFLCS